VDLLALLSAHLGLLLFTLLCSLLFVYLAYAMTRPERF
jgi:K+-transporting ATPase KdpF subunit